MKDSTLIMEPAPSIEALHNRRLEWFVKGFFIFFALVVIGSPILIVIWVPNSSIFEVYIIRLLAILLFIVFPFLMAVLIWLKPGRIQISTKGIDRENGISMSKFDVEHFRTYSITILPDSEELPDFMFNVHTALRFSPKIQTSIYTESFEKRIELAIMVDKYLTEIYGLPYAGGEKPDLTLFMMKE